MKAIINNRYAYVSNTIYPFFAAYYVPKKSLLHGHYMFAWQKNIQSVYYYGRKHGVYGYNNSYCIIIHSKSCSYRIFQSIVLFYFVQCIYIYCKYCNNIHNNMYTYMCCSERMNSGKKSTAADPGLAVRILFLRDHTEAATLLHDLSGWNIGWLVNQKILLSFCLGSSKFVNICLWSKCVIQTPNFPSSQYGLNIWSYQMILTVHGPVKLPVGYFGLEVWV